MRNSLRRVRTDQQTARTAQVFVICRMSGTTVKIKQLNIVYAFHENVIEISRGVEQRMGTFIEFYTKAIQMLLLCTAKPISFKFGP